MQSKTLVVVPCGSRKIWDKSPKHGPTKAEEAYVSAVFQVNRDFAKKFAERWVILSAKYGFIDPGFTIPKNYNVSFNEPVSNPISQNQLEAQLKEKGLENYDVIVTLGGKNYTDIAKKVFPKSAKVLTSTKGLPLGKAMKFVKVLTGLGKEEMLKKVE